MDEFTNNHDNEPVNNNGFSSSPENSPERGPIDGEYRYVPPRNQGYYDAYKAPQQPNNNQYANYYTPPGYTQPTPPQDNTTVVNGTVEGFENKKKKKNKTIITIVIILVICVALAIAGSVMASFNKESGTDLKEKTTQSQSNNDDSQAKVEGSDKAAKTDSDGNLTAAGVAEKNIDSCVGITVYTAQSAYNYFYSYGYGSNNDGNNEVASGAGSGVIMSESGGKTYIMTAAHVIADGSKFTVTLNNDEEYDATMVGYDGQTDIGVLSINKTGLAVATFGDSNDIEVGEACVAIGCPGGLDFKNSVTQGIVSALDRPVESSIGYNTKCIQVDAAINPGNSGGALFNMQGQVIGINSSKIASTDYEGMGFAVPSNTAVETANSLIKNGYVAGRAMLGIEYSPLSNFNNASAILAELEKQGFKKAEGTMVVQTINDESDLKNSDVKQYDMIVAVNGKTMTSTDIMTSVLSESKPGDTVTLTIARVENNAIKTFKVKCKLVESKQ